MRPNRLLNLLARNEGRGAFKAEGNTIFLYDVIVASEADAAWLGGVSAEAFVKTLASLTGPVLVRINSPGGDVFAGVAMAQAVRAYADGVTVQVDGLAASAASVVAVAAGETIMAQGAMMMIHKAWTIDLGNADDFRATAALLDKIDGEIVAAYARKCGDSTDFAALMAAETWMTADEAVSMGLADKVDATPAKAPQAQARAWDLSAYSKAPQDTCVTVTHTLTVEVEDDDAADPTDPMDPNDPACLDASTLNAERRARIHAVRMLQTAA